MRSNFERRFRLYSAFAKAWIVFCSVIIIAVISVGVIAAIELANDPAMIGRLFGEIANGFDEARK